jgi:hypothetical protein
MERKKNAISTPADWQVELDLRTMIEAEQIEKDPKRMAKIKALAKERMMEIASIASETE